MSKIIGIDLGTTNTCSAFVSNKIPRVIPIEGGFNTMPSVVCLHPSGSVLVGQSAKEQMIGQPEHTFHGIKRLLGRQYSSKVVQELKRRVSYKIVAGEGGEAAVSAGGKTYAAVELLTKILSHVKRYAEIHLGEDIPDAVIAVPAYFSDHQRALVKKAGAQARFNVRRIVNEPTAAALAYGFNRGFDQKVVIYDLGGGTFDVSILEITGNVFQVIATGGDTFLGGADFDGRITDWIVETFKRQSKVDVTDDLAAMQRIRQAAERAKIELSLLINTQIRISPLLERKGKAIDLDLRLDRETLNQSSSDLVQRTVAVTDRVLAERKLSLGDIDELIFVGGQTRMPQVVDTISTHFGKQPRKGVNPDECVALGAALLGDSLAKIESVTLLDAISVPIGVASADGSLRIVIDKHTQLPFTGRTELPTTADSQAEMQIEVFQGEAGPLANAEYLGTMTYRQLPAAPAGSVRVGLEFSLDAEGMLTIVAKHSQGGAPETLQLATRERPVAIVDGTSVAGAEESVSAEEAGKPGSRGFLRNLWSKPR